jgi:hypothetical protein
MKDKLLSDMIFDICNPSKEFIPPKLKVSGKAMDFEMFPALPLSLSGPEKNPGNIMAEIITNLKMMLPPPAPTSEAEAKMQMMAMDLGWKPVVGAIFSLDIVHRFLNIAPGEPEAIKILSIAHELGHAIRFKEDPKREAVILKGRLPLAFKSAQDTRNLIIEEVLAWREGMKICRDLGVRFSSRRAARHFRNDCLSTYRVNHGVHRAAIRALTVKS